MECPISNTSSGKRLTNMCGLGGELLARLERAIPMIRIWRKEIDCPEFWRVFEFGFWAGFQFMQEKEKKRHYHDADIISADIRNLEALTGLKIKEQEIPADLWVDVPEI